MTTSLAPERGPSLDRASSLPYRPELDGVRAIAVIVVLLFHAGISWFSGGYVGVSLFFTLSGFLITRLLIAELERTDRVRLGHFWMRRVRRLLPASLLCLALVFIASWTGLLPAGEHLRRDGWAATFQVFNWVQLTSDQSYTELFTGTPGALDHYWSLAVEEQFYWLWPIVVLVLARRTNLRGGIVALTALAFVVAPLIAVVFGGDAAYWATPARAGEILAGCALAVLTHRTPTPSPVVGTSAASIGLIAVIVCAITWPAASGPAYSGWMPVFAMASVAVIWGSSSGPITGVLSNRALVAIGGVSYGLYLYHWPVYLVITEERTGWGIWTLTLVRLAVTAAMAIASYRFLEQPIRHGRFTDRQVLVGVGCGTALVLVASLLVSPPSARFASSRADAALAAIPAVVDSAPLRPVSTAPAVATDVTVDSDPGPDDPAVDSVPSVQEPSELASLSFGDELVSSAVLGPLTLAEPPPSRPVRIIVAGDSTAWSMGDGLVDWAERHPEYAQVLTIAAPACTLLSGVRADPDNENWLPRCTQQLRENLPETVAQFAPDLVVAMVSVADVEEVTWDEAEGVLVPPDERFAARMRADYAAFSDSLIAQGAGGVVLVKGPRAMSTLRSFSSTDDSWRPGRMEMQHAVIADVASNDADIEVLDLNRWYLSSEYGVDDSGRSDGVHLDDAVAVDVADRFVGPWLVAVALHRAGG